MDRDSKIPPELDDLLKSIRNAMNADEKKSSAIVPTNYVADEKKEEQLVNEDIDPVILKLLGLEDVFDIDYSTYKTLLREKMMEGRMSETKMSSEETEVLTDEFKRIKGKSGRFKVKKKTEIKLDDTVPAPEAGVSREPSSERINFNKFLPGTAEKIEEQQVKEERKSDEQEKSISGIKKFISFLEPALEKIENNLKSLLDTRNQEFELKKKQDKMLANQENTDRKKAREAKLEEKPEKSGGGNLLDKALKPAKGFFDMILDFLKNMLLGSALLNLMNLIKDPGYVLNPIIRFANSLIGFVNQAIGFLNNILNYIYMFTIDPLNAMISGINSAGNFIFGQLNNIAGLVGAEDLFAYENIEPIPKPTIPLIPLIDEIERNQEYIDSQAGKSEPINMGEFLAGSAPPQAQSPATEAPTPATPGMKGGGLVQGMQGGPIQYNISNFGYNQGGKISGSSGMTIKGMGPDTQLIAAQPGEIVMSKGAVDKFGADTLLSMNKMGGGTNKPSIGYPVMPMYGGGYISPDVSNIGNGLISKDVLVGAGIEPITGYQGGGMVGVSADAPYDVILPLDHVKPENMFKIPDTPGGNTFKNARMTGAAGRERDHQGKAAELIKKDLIDKGLRVKIVTPEEHGNYEDYDKYLTGMASKGVRVVPLHFDAVRSAGGIGFLTRTRAGDKDDAAFAAPIQQVLTDFQAANPDLGNISADTKGNATINRASAAPAALVELGVMTDWEDKYGKDFTQTDKFKSLASGVAGAIYQGGGFQQRSPQAQPQSPKIPSIADNETKEMVKQWNSYNAANNALAVLTSQYKDALSLYKDNRDEKIVKKIMINGVGSYVRGTGFFGGREDKFFTPTGQSISLAQFDKLYNAKKEALENAKLNAQVAYHEEKKKEEQRQLQLVSSSSQPQQAQPQQPQTAQVQPQQSAIPSASTPLQQNIDPADPNAQTPNTQTQQAKVDPTSYLGKGFDFEKGLGNLSNNDGKPDIDIKVKTPQGQSRRISTSELMANYDFEKGLGNLNLSPSNIKPSPKPSNITPPGQSTSPSTTVATVSAPAQQQQQQQASSGATASKASLPNFSPVNPMEMNIAVKSIYNLVE